LDACLVGGHIYAIGERGALIRSEDSGKNWESISLPVNATLTGITFADSHRGWIVGHDGTLLFTNDGGSSWNVQPLKDSDDVSFLDTLAFDAQRVIAVGAFGTFLSTTDGGRSWISAKVLSEDLHLNLLTRGAGSSFFIAGERGTLLSFADFRAVPRLLTTGYEGSFNGIVLLADTALLAYGLRGHAFRSEDQGGTWTPVPGLPPVLLSTAVQLKSGLVVMAGQARIFLVSRDNGRTFSRWATGVTTAVAKLLEAPDDTLLAFGEAGVSRLVPPALADSPANPAGMR
jgi:photosystem II stability/assembly factor-like uncharacterized protein